MNSQLTQELAALGPPDIERARARAVVAVTERVQAARLHQRQDRRRTQVAFATLALALSAVCAACALWTAPGQAVTTWIGERVGVGQPGGPPALQELRASWNRGTAADGQAAYVLVAGPAPQSGKYEFVTYRPKGQAVTDQAPAEIPCFELNLRHERSSTSQGCGVLPGGGDLYSSGFGGGFGRTGAEIIYTAGRTSMAVTAVDVRFNGSSVNAELVPVSETLLGRMGIERPFKFFIAFLPGAASGGDAVVTARGVNGRDLARKVAHIPDLLAAGAGPRSPAAR